MTHSLPALPDSESYHPDSPPLFPPTTFSCASCERILGDHSTLLFSHLGIHLIFSALPQARTAATIHTSPPGSWDQHCTFSPLECTKCSHPIGRRYVATRAELSHFADTCVVDITKIAVYVLGAGEPAISPAACSDALRALHPDADNIANNLTCVFSVCVRLNEDQRAVAAGVAAVARVLGMEVGARIGELARQCAGGTEDVAGVTMRQEIRQLQEAVESMKAVVGGKLPGLDTPAQSVSNLASTRKLTPPPSSHPVTTMTTTTQRTIVPDSQGTEGGILSFQESSPPLQRKKPRARSKPEQADSDTEEDMPPTRRVRKPTTSFGKAKGLSVVVNERTTSRRTSDRRSGRK